MIYLDNAATTMRKPQEVVDAVVAAMGSLGNAGRGASAGALDAGRTVWRCREAVAALLGCPRADHVCFSANSTAALNAALSGLVGPGDRVVTTVLEHNSVLRPLARLADERGVEVVYAGCDERGYLCMHELERLVTPGTRLVAVTHGSNVTGNLVDVARVAQIAHAAGALCLVDASQTAGSVPLDMAAMGLDVVCFTGHKGLMGPQGTGGMAVAEGIDVRPWAEGGSGVHSFERRHPQEWPTRLEAGTLNAHGLAGLAAGIAFIEKNGGPAAVGAREHALARRLYEGVAGVPGVTVYGGWPEAPERCGSIVAVGVAGLDSAEVADALSSGWGIACRAGAHCAPLMHRALGTERQGIVRLSCGWFNTEEEVDVAAAAVREIAAS
ncbi:aminotransferase class V-fold PLP-dependent enzyme [Thermophilibacter sp. ET337]|uniref:aminotransferase class V-fold PLP-dependent enzyme n=1 Tax=Thermophilibacter sp. ET337 TaxID=2973084 RepID=UPI0021ACB6E4|nr:aminotransferase class V-fold PLP-dependent enzyme [Thermophilibacter sp. ET337]MCR8907934.1 aminotransferase class V-fold PLP-dependent enzyme [Thermophilibacter sp. ET337]